METYIAALDQGTTTSRAILFNSRGEIVSKAQYPFRQIFPQPGWVEHDPMEIWATTVRALSEAVDAAHIDPKAIAGVGITNQRETAILWDRRTGQPVYNAIVWQCRRTADICDKLIKDGYSDYIKKQQDLYPMHIFRRQKSSGYSIMSTAHEKKPKTANCCLAQ